MTNWHFENFDVFQKKRKKNFLKFSIFQNLSKNIFHRKNKQFSDFFLLFIFLSYLMYNLSEWHRGTPTVPPVGTLNVPTENPKIQKIHIFEDFWGHFFLIRASVCSISFCIRIFWRANQAGPLYTKAPLYTDRISPYFIRKTMQKSGFCI